MLPIRYSVAAGLQSAYFPDGVFALPFEAPSASIEDVLNGTKSSFQRRHFLQTCGATAAVGLFSARLNADEPVEAAPGGRWIRERIYRGEDRLCGAKIFQLTSSAHISHGIYGEQLYCSADGNRVAFLRAYTSDTRDGPMDLFVYDRHRKGVKKLGRAAFFLVAGNGERDSLHYIRKNDDDTLAIVHVNFSTLEQTQRFVFGDCPRPQFRGLLAISPDDRHCVIVRKLGDRRYGLERIDMNNDTWGLIHKHDDIFNAHLQFNPAGSQILVQHNRGGYLDDSFNVNPSTGPEGATLYVIDAETGQKQALPVGEPYTTRLTGHECWVGQTGRILMTCRGGKVYVIAPGDEKAQLIAVGSGFIHITASPDGRYFVVDQIGTGRLFLGCIATKRVLPLCDSGASGGSAQYTHTHPYITPENRRVIFNSDRTGIPQVYSADIPETLLAELSAE